RLAKSKAIVSRLEAIEELAGVDVLCSDKTGTLTQNKLTLGEAQPWAGTDAQTLILMASVASRPADNDPIDLAIMAGLKDSSVLKSYQQENYVPFDPVGKRTEATIKDASGKVFKVTKGAPQVVLGLAKLSGADLEKAQQTVNGFASRGYRTIGVAVAQGDGPWVFLGILPLLDPPRPDSKSTIARAREYGVEGKMVTGDNVAIARQISLELDMGTNIQPATELFPGNINSNCTRSFSHHRRDRRSQAHLRANDELRVISHRDDDRHHGICSAGIDLLSLLSSDRDYAYRARSSGRCAYYDHRLR